jgi:transposase
MPPGIYLPDATEGIIDVKDLPKPQIVQRSRNYPSQCCPQCDRGAARLRTYQRTLHELGDPIQNRPRDLHVTYSQHYCKHCDHYFNADMLDLATPGGHYTHRVVATAVRCVVEDGLPYRTASWHLWRDHRVFVPFATIQNWVEAAGEKSPQAGRAGVSRRRVGRFLRVHRH